MSSTQWRISWPALTSRDAVSSLHTLLTHVKHLLLRLCGHFEHAQTLLFFLFFLLCVISKPCLIIIFILLITKAVMWTDSGLPSPSSRWCYFQHVRHAAGPLQDVPWSEGERNVICSQTGGLHVRTRRRSVRLHDQYVSDRTESRSAGFYFCFAFARCANVSASKLRLKCCYMFRFPCLSLLWPDVKHKSHSCSFLLSFRAIFQSKKVQQLLASGQRAWSASKQMKGKTLEAGM